MEKYESYIYIREAMLDNQLPPNAIGEQSFLPQVKFYINVVVLNLSSGLEKSLLGARAESGPRRFFPRSPPKLSINWCQLVLGVNITLQ